MYWLTGKAVVYPGVFGAHSLYPMAFSPLTGLVYVSGWDNGMIVTYERRAEQDKTGVFELSSGNTFFDALGLAHEAKAPLIAWDPVERKIRWKLDELPPMGGGTMATAGNLVFYGKGDGLLRAFAADSGKVLWSVQVPGAVRSTPITVEVDGEQIILVPIGSDGGGAGITMGDLAATAATRQAPARLLAFKLGGSARLPALDASNAFAEPPLPRFPADVVKKGSQTMLAYACDFCHGGEKLQANLGTVPDLRKATAATHVLLDKIVIGGAYKLRGMPQFADMPVDDLKLIQAFIIDRAWDAYDEQERAKAKAPTQ
jgi:quinohemoprotein ethanol dehydrogenase